jgi:hypothetical protein
MFEQYTLSIASSKSIRVILSTNFFPNLMFDARALGLAGRDGRIQALDEQVAKHDREIFDSLRAAFAYGRLLPLF